MVCTHVPSRFFLIILAWGACLLLFVQTTTAQDPEFTWADTLQAEALIRESGQLNRQDQHEAALEKARQAFSIYRHLFGDSHVKTSRARMYVAREYRNFNRLEEATGLFSESLLVFEAALDTQRMAICHHNIGLCLRDQNQYTEAMQHARTAIALMQPDSVNQASFIADMQVNVGSILNAEKKYLEAIPVLEAAKSLYSQKKNARSLGEVSYHLGAAWFGLHDFSRAREHYLTALSSLKNELTPNHSYFADLCVKIGLCYQKNGEPETGLSYMLDARDAYLKAGADNLNYIHFLQYLGQYYLDEGLYDQAVKTLDSCLLAKENRYGSGNPLLMNTIQVLADARIKAGQYALAENGYRRLLQLANDSLGGQYPFLYRFYGKLAEIRLLTGDVDGSLHYCDTAFATAGADFKQIRPRDYFRELCQIYAQALLEQYKRDNEISTLSRAEEYFGRASETLFQELEEISINSSREIFYDQDFPVLEQWLDARLQLYGRNGDPQHLETAFRIAGQAKAFLLASAMRQNDALRYSGIPDSLLSAELSLRGQIVSAERALDATGHRSTAQMDSLELELNTRLSAWRTAYDNLLHSISVNYPDYYRLRFQQGRISTAEIKKSILAPGQALLMFSQTPSGLSAFVLSPDTFCVKMLPPNSSLDAAINRFRWSVTAYFEAADPEDALYDQCLESYTRLAQSLYQQLIVPVAALLPERVVIIPDGKLNYLPFEALLIAPPGIVDNFRSYPFWGNNKAISYALSTDYLAETHAPPEKAQVKPWLGIAPFSAAPQVNKTTVRLPTHEEFPPLLNSGKEVRDIAALTGGETWLGDEAWPGRFQDSATSYRILHLATHARADDRLGDHSFLAVSASGAPMPAKALYQLSMPAEMVVLSACETGGGKLLRGEGIIGLVRGFAYAGARSIVASQWVANDQSTAQFMVEFYRQLKAGLPKDLALKAARQALLNRPAATGHPFFWAGFRVYGNDGSVY